MLVIKERDDKHQLSGIVDVYYGDELHSGKRVEAQKIKRPLLQPCLPM